MAKIRSLPTPIIPLSEQLRIVTEVERRLSIIHEVELEVESDLKRGQRLRQAILKQAFEGKLVPQDPNEESASALLERIRGTANPGCALPARNTRASQRKPLGPKETANV
jgi:type I restriction enzyme, S subunit